LFQGGVWEENLWMEKPYIFWFVYSTHEKLHNEVNWDVNVSSTRRQAVLTAMIDGKKESCLVHNRLWFLHARYANLCNNYLLLLFLFGWIYCTMFRFVWGMRTTDKAEVVLAELKSTFNTFTHTDFKMHLTAQNYSKSVLFVPHIYKLNIFQTKYLHNCHIWRKRCGMVTVSLEDFPKLIRGCIDTVRKKLRLLFKYFEPTSQGVNLPG